MSNKKNIEAEDPGCEPKRPNAFKRARAFLCHKCPFCNYGRKHPDSLLGRIIHHPLHADHCPMWKAEQELYGEES